jgi:PAS domain S-box-containing protein
MVPHPPAAPAPPLDVSLPSVQLERLARIAIRGLRVPVAYVGAETGGWQRIVAAAGIPGHLRGSVVPFEETICARVQERVGALAIPDVAAEPGLRDLQRVRDLAIGAYVGVALRGVDGVAGTLCAIDRQPRDWTAEGISLVTELGAAAEYLLRDSDQRRWAARRLRLERSSTRTMRRELEDTAVFRFVLENSLCGIYVIQNGRFVFVNPMLAELLEYTPHTIRGVPVREVVAPGDRARVEEAIRRRVTGEIGSLRQTFSARTRTGRDVPVESLGVAVEYRGTPAIVGTLLDVGDRVRAEAALRQNLQRYQLVVRATGSVVRDWDLASGQLRWEGPVGVLFREAEGAVGSTVDWWYSRVDPEDRERVMAGIQSVLEGTGDVWSAEYRLRRVDSSIATVLDSCFVVRDEHGRPARVVGSIFDVTERKRTEETQRFLARASAVLEGSLDPHVTFSRLARIVVPEIADYCLVDLLEEDGELRRVAAIHTDPEYQKILRMDERHPAEGDLDRHPALRVVRTGEPVLVSECTDEVIDRIGHDAEHRAGLRALGLTSFMIVPLAGRERIHGALTLGSSVSGRRFWTLDLLLAQDLGRRAGAAIEHARLYEEARAAIEARDEVLRLVSHDLRNPISSIRLGAAMLLDAHDDRREDRTRVLQVIERASDAMDRMIEDLLEVTTLEGGRTALNVVAEDPVALLESSRDLLLPIAEQQRIVLEVSSAPGVPAVRADRHHILRVLSNLVGNAIKFAPEGSRVRLSAEPFQGYVRFCVSDQGPGIPPDHLPHVFDRYWQARRGDRRGAGLGLAIARGLVEAHGGSIWVESRPGEGASFYFTVPCAS